MWRTIWWMTKVLLEGSWPGQMGLPNNSEKLRDTNLSKNYSRNLLTLITRGYKVYTVSRCYRFAITEHNLNCFRCHKSEKYSSGKCCVGLPINEADPILFCSFVSFYRGKAAVSIGGNDTWATEARRSSIGQQSVVAGNGNLSSLQIIDLAERSSNTH